MNKKVICLGVFASMLAFNISAQEEQKKEVKEKTVNLKEIVVVSDSKFELKKENSGKVVHQISKELIEQNTGKDVVDLINQISGFEINGNTTGSGQNLGIFVRGGSTKEVVVLIDGVQVSNPSGFSAVYDLRLLDLNDVNSVEIIKGAASTLYGTGATTAVINIKLKEAKDGVVNTTLSVASGTNNSQEETVKGHIVESKVNINGKVKKFNYLVNVSVHDANGISASESETGNTASTFNDDPFQRFSSRVKLGYDFTEKFTVSAFGSFSSFDNSFDAGSFADGNNFSEDKSYRVSISPKYKYNNGSVEINAAYSKYESDRVQTSFPGIDEGENYIIDAYVKHKINNLHLVGGVNYQYNKIETFSIPFGGTELTETVFTEEPKSEFIDPYVNAVYVTDFGLNLNGGVRLNNHNRYGSHFVYNFNPSFTLKQEKGYLKFLASYSTAFLAPSVQELFSSFGNLDLEPQESTTLEAGVEYKLNSLEISGVFFNRELDNILGFDANTFASANLGDTTIKGFEFNLGYNFLNNLKFNANYSFTENDEVAIRIPKNKVNAGLYYILKERTNFGLTYQYLSDRDDTDFRSFSSENVVLDSYSLLDFSVNHKLNDNVKLFLDVTNITNEDYQEVLGFSTLGRNYKLGVQFDF